MTILFPKSIIDRKDAISQLKLKVGSFEVVIHEDMYRIHSSVDIHPNAFEKCCDIHFEVMFQDATMENIVCDKYSLLSVVSRKHINSDLKSIVRPLIRQNINTIYKDTIEDKKTIFDIMKLKAASALQLSPDVKGTKNLVYFSVGGNTSYSDMLQVCLHAIISRKTSDFDFLFICPPDWANTISTFPELANQTIHFLPINMSSDGVRVALNRMRVFDFDGIDEYQNILYLDTDILVLDDIDGLFTAALPNKLMTAYNEKITMNAHKSFFHGLEFISTETLTLINDNNQQPFNSGQYLFKNSDQMKAHFDNVNWLSRVWSGEYFTDQAFLNVYFCHNLLTEPALQPFTEIYNLTEVNSKPIGNKTLLHFIGKCQEGQAKLDVMNNFITSGY